MRLDQIAIWGGIRKYQEIYKALIPLKLRGIRAFPISSDEIEGFMLEQDSVSVIIFFLCSLGVQNLSPTIGQMALCPTLSYQGVLREEVAPVQILLSSRKLRPCLASCPGPSSSFWERLPLDGSKDLTIFDFLRVLGDLPNVGDRRLNHPHMAKRIKPRSWSIPRAVRLICDTFGVWRSGMPIPRDFNRA
jgi:hypothetical protein